MTLDEHRASIIAQVQQQTIQLLIDALAKASAEIETLKTPRDTTGSA